jgi:hypothetical protein
MIAIEDIFGIDNCEIQTYSAYIHGDYMHPDISPSRDIEYPECKNIHYDDLSVDIGKLQTVKDTLQDRDLFLIPGYLQYGDYDNSCMVERSNQKLFLEDYEKESGVFTITGGYGSSGIAISIKWLLNPDNEEIAESILEVLKGLNDYPCLDDGDMSNMEYDAFYEALEDYGIEDTKRALSRKYGITVNDYDREKLKELILEIDRNGNPVFMIESGGLCYIDVDDMIVPKITRDQYIETLTDYEVL